MIAPALPIVIPVKTGIHTVRAGGAMDSRFHGNDDGEGRDNSGIEWSGFYDFDGEGS